MTSIAFAGRASSNLLAVREALRANSISVEKIRCLRARSHAQFWDMLAARQILGERGERIAEDWLKARGWEVLDRRFRSGHRDIDLVVERKGGVGGGVARTVAFVEVKTRASGAYGGPLGAVHWRKQREMTRAARDWIARNRRAGDDYRFDVIGIVWGRGTPEVVHVENAFRVR